MFGILQRQSGGDAYAAEAKTSISVDVAVMAEIGFGSFEHCPKAADRGDDGPSSSIDSTGASRPRRSRSVRSRV